jgi:glucose/arabinose dehydrogenase/cytochrome c553
MHLSICSIVKAWNLLVVLLVISECKNDQLRTAHDPSPMLTPAQELKTFQLESGLKIQLVASEPMIQDPVVMTFDEDGRLWVVEMRGFMMDIDGKGERDRVGRVSILEDTNLDGLMDTSVVYIDSLILPRAIAIVPHGALIVENAALWLTQDLNHDMHADTKTLIDSTYAGNLLPEHSGNGLWRGLDNWYYNAKSKLRYRFSNGHWSRDSTEFRGQWGMSHDDEGRLYYNYNWSQLHADLVPPNYFNRNRNHTTTTGLDQGLTLDRKIFPIRPTPAVNRGYVPGTLDANGKLLEFTAACSPFYYRSHALPEEYYGNVFVCEPSGNLVKRNIIKEEGLTLSAFDPHSGQEFLASTDERFRPVFLATGPDGALYVTDMYRGLIQHGAYVTPYLREQTIKRNLVLPVHCGRIWKIVPEHFHPEPIEHLSSMTSSQLIPYLSHPNGWFRDIAQRLLVESNERTVIPLLSNLILSKTNSLGRVHALWTLEGMQALSPALLVKLLSDSSESIRRLSIRLLEPMALKDAVLRVRLGKSLLTMFQKAESKGLLQIALSAGVLNETEALPILSGIIHLLDTSALIRDAVLSSLYHKEYSFYQFLESSHWFDQVNQSKQIFLELLVTSILRNGDSNQISRLLSGLRISTPLSWYTATILNAISIQGYSKAFKSILLPAAPAILTQAKISFDSSRLNILKNMFEWPGHKASKSDDSLSVKAYFDTKQYTLGRQHFLSSCAGCHGVDGQGINRYAPALAGSDWVLGNEKRLALLLIHGIEGPIEVKGKLYDAPEILPVMPSHAILDDSELAAVMSYIRNEWGNIAPPVSTRTVGGARIMTQGRVMPWTATELNKHIRDTIAVK